MKENVLDGMWGKIKSKIRPQWKAAFVSSFIVGLLAYGYMMTNHFLTYDSMWNQISSQNMITSGRQFLTYACGFSSYYDLPLVNGFIAILFLALTSVVLVEIFDIKSSVSAALTGGILVAFPAVISTFSYMYTVDGYMIAVFLSAVAVLVTDKKKKGFLGGIILLGVSLGIYQAYYSFAIVLCILKLLLNILDKKSFKEIFAKALQYIVMGVGAYIFYIVTLKIMLHAQGLALSGYQGVDKLDGFALSELPRGIWRAIKTFIWFLADKHALSTTGAMKVAVWGLILLAAFSYVYLFVKVKLQKKWLYALLAIALLIVTPVGATLVCVMSPDAYFHLIMRLPWALFFVFALVVVERVLQGENLKWVKRKNALSFLTLGFAAVLIFQFVIVSNVAAFNLEKRFEKTNSLCIRIVDRLEQMPGYERGMKVALIGGGVDQGKYPYTDLTSSYLRGYYGVEGTLTISSVDDFASFLFHYLNVTIIPASYEEEVEAALTEEFQEMGTFPAEDSIRLINDIWVIKLNG